MVNNYLEIVIINLVCLSPLPDGSCALPYIFPSAAGGNIDLTEETLDSLEFGWVGTFGPSTVTLSIYETETTDAIDFYTAATYTAAFPPPGFPLPPFVLDVPPPLGLAGQLPAAFSYRNIGEITNTGVEFSWQLNPRTSPWGFNFNASWQDKPEVKGIPQERLPNGMLVDPINQPPEWRVNTAGTYNSDSWFGSLVLNYQDEAFWTDILDSRFWGPTDSFTSVDFSLGYRFSDAVALSVSGQNITDEEIQQHVFGDIISRKWVGFLTLDL
jgi:outer membrane receptor protein involved in Fe transport